MEWNLARDRVLRIDVYWYRRRPKKKRPERDFSPEVLELERLERERTIREVEERRRQRASERDD